LIAERCTAPDIVHIRADDGGHDAALHFLQEVNQKIRICVIRVPCQGYRQAGFKRRQDPVPSPNQGGAEIVDIAHLSDAKRFTPGRWVSSTN